MRYIYKDLIACGMTAITAHSGCEGTAPNSIEHIRSAIASGSEFIEIDVRKKDDWFYLSHDIPEQPEKCVKLTECFHMVAAENNLYMNIDVKEYGLIPAILELSDVYNLRNRIIFTGCCNDDRELAVNNGSEMWRSMFKGDFIPDGIAANCRDGSPALNVYHKLINNEYNAELVSKGFGFSAWTVDTEEDIRRYLEMGIMNITTRKPVLAMRLRDEIQGPSIDFERLKMIVKSAGKMILNGVSGRVYEKDGSANYVTECDKSVEKYLKTELQNLCPIATFFGEESGGFKSRFMFIVDPIDGTSNFIHDMHHSAVSVAFAKNDTVQCGIVYNPYCDEMFWAEIGKGAYLNSNPIHVSDREGNSALIGVGASPYNKSETADKTISIAAKAFIVAGDIRRMGSAALDLCSVACGRLDSYYEMTLCPWDHAAGGLIVTEAGGCISRMNGAGITLDSKTDIIASNKRMFPIMLEICK